MRFFLIWLAAAALAGQAAAQTATAPARAITVSATGKVEITPDRAVLPVQLTSNHRSLAAAKADNDKRMEALLKVTEQYGIKQEKLKTYGVNINPRYRWDEKSNKQIFEGYQVFRSVQVTLDEVEILEKFIESLTKAGIEEINGVQFTAADPEAQEAAARKAAVHKAQAQARELADAAGVKLGRLMSLTPAESHYSPPMPYRAMAMREDAAAAPAAPPPLPGVMTIEQSVTLVYEIE